MLSMRIGALLGNYELLYVVDAKVYYGDGDEYQTIRKKYDSYRASQVDAMKANLIMLLKLQEDQGRTIETHEQMVEWLVSKGVDEDLVDIPVDSMSYEMLPGGFDEEVTVTYYDEAGKAYEVEIELKEDE